MHTDTPRKKRVSDSENIAEQSWFIDLKSAVLERTDSKQSGVNWMVRCVYPNRHANGDRSPSLSFNSGTGLWNCKGCGAKGNAWHLAEVLGIHTDHKTERSVSLAPKRIVPAAPQRPCTDSPKEICAALPSAWGTRSAPDGGPWDYLDKDHRPLLRVFRYNRRGTKKKDILTFNARQWLFVGEGGAAVPDPRPLYNLHILHGDPSDPVVFVSGEKCAQALTDIGILATTGHGGELSLIHI